MIGLRLNAGRDKNHWEVPSFQFYFNHVAKKYPRGLFRVCLPVDYLNRSETDFAVLLQESMAEFPLTWGFAGYSFYWNTLLDDIEYRIREPMAETLKRHPGVSYRSLRADTHRA